MRGALVHTGADSETTRGAAFSAAQTRRTTRATAAAGDQSLQTIISLGDQVGEPAQTFVNALVQNNYISVVGGSAIVTPNTGWSATPPAGRMFVFKNNTCNAPPFEMFSWPANGVICEDNTITNGWGNWNRYGTMNTASGFVSVAAGATGSVTTVLEGARATLDTIVCVPQAATALIIWGNVSSNDNVTVYAYNPTAGALTPPSVKYYAKRAAANF